MMIEIYKTPSKEIQEVILANLTYETVIDGLNEYFASEPRNDYITVKMEIDKQDSELYAAEAWADILISWLRTEHGIFYYPGMEAKHAKSEKIKPFTERMMDEGALNRLKDLHKRVTGKEAGIKYFVNEKESEIKKLKKRIAEAEEEVIKLKTELNTLKDIVSMARSRLNSKFISLPGYENDLVKLADIALRAVDARDETISRINVTAQKKAKQECYDYLWNALKNLSPDCDALKITDYEDLVDRIFYEMSLVEDGCKRCQRGHTTEKFDYIQKTNKAEEEVKKLKEQLDKATADYQALSEEYQKVKNSVFDLEKTCYRESYISDRIHEICTAKGVELDDAFLYNDDYTWEDLVGFLCEEIRKLKKEVEDAQKETVCEGIMGYIRYEASRNGFELPEEIDGEPLTIKRVFHDLLELMRKRGAEIRYLNTEIKAKESGIEDLKEHITLLEADLKKRAMEIKEVNDKRWKDLRDINKALGYDGMDGHVDDFAKAVKARAECAKMALGEESDINALIREYCTKNGIVAPSRYFSEKACVEYLFSVIDLKQKDRSFTILQDLYRDIFKRQPDGLSAEDIANKILDRMLETEDLLHKSVDSVNKECKATGKLMVEDYEKDLLQFIYKEYKDRIHLSDETITYNPPSVRNTVLKIISDYARCRTRNDILETRIKSIFDRCKANFTVDDYVLNGNPTTSFMLDCISSWISSPAESRGKVRAEIENYKLKLKDYILKDIEEHGYRYDGLEKKSIEEIVNWIITMATCPRNEWAKDEIKKLRGQIDSLKSLINAMNEEVKDM